MDRLLLLQFLNAILRSLQRLMVIHRLRRFLESIRVLIRNRSTESFLIFLIGLGDGGIFRTGKLIIIRQVLSGGVRIQRWKFIPEAIDVTRTASRHLKESKRQCQTSLVANGLLWLTLKISTCKPRALSQLNSR